MIIYTSPQGTPEWHNDRAGVITASNFAECCKRMKSGANKGGFSKAAKDYAFRLAIERISGCALDEGGFETHAMRRGRELESFARSLHEMRADTVVDEVGFVSTDDRKFGASADGFIGDSRGAEYKCFISPEKLQKLLIDDDLSDVMYQIQGGLWITGRTIWDFGLYCPALESIGKDFKLVPVDRDEKFISEMEVKLLEFDAEVERLKALLVGDEMPPKLPTPQPSAHASEIRF